jgi:hypothetical protein
MAKVQMPDKFRRKDRARSGRSVVLAADHMAIVEGRTLFPSTVKLAGNVKRLLKSGTNSSKCGTPVAKGRLAGFPIYTLTLQERATCPSSCHHWNSCYGNNMHFAERIVNDADFERMLWLELEALQSRHPAGFLIRLHVLGDFYSEAYVKLWLSALDTFPALHVFGYTARGLESPIGKLIYTAALVRWDRFAIRFSGEDWRELGAPTIQVGEEHPVAITCPAQLDKTACCSTCGICWSTRRSVAFQQHGSKAA